MDKKNNTAVFVILAIVAVIIWLFIKRPEFVDNVIQQIAGALPVAPGAAPYTGSAAGNVTYQQGDFNYRGASKGCSMCFSGYQRLVLPSAPAPAPNATPTVNIINYINQQYTPPTPRGVWSG